MSKFLKLRVVCDSTMPAEAERIINIDQIVSCQAAVLRREGPQQSRVWGTVIYMRWDCFIVAEELEMVLGWLRAIEQTT